MPTSRDKRSEVNTDRTINRDGAFLLTEEWGFLLTEAGEIIELEQSEKPTDTDRTKRTVI